jgi:hypothetical protein
MNDRYGELERLQRLRESGALTDEEFQVEKRRVLGGTPSALPVLETPEEDLPVEQAGDREERNKRAILYIMLAMGGLIVAILIGVWLGRDVGGGQGAPEANIALPQTEPAQEDNMIVAVPPTNIRALPVAEQLTQAFSAAFGTAGSATLQVAGRTINYRPGQFFWIGDRGVLISPGTASDDCHACAGAVAVHYLELAADGLKVTGSWPEAVSGEGYGAPPKWKLTSQFTTAPAIFEEGGATGQGCTSGSATLTELTPAGPIQSGPIRMVYAMDPAALAAGTAPIGDVQGTIANVVKDTSFDVNYSGEQPFTEHWVKRGARFVLESGETRMPQC